MTEVNALIVDSARAAGDTTLKPNKEHNSCIQNLFKARREARDPERRKSLSWDFGENFGRKGGCDSHGKLLRLLNTDKV